MPAFVPELDRAPGRADRRTGPRFRSTSSRSWLATMARSSCRCGEGADEIFHGYKGYADHRRYVAAVPARLPVPCSGRSGGAAARLTRRLGRGMRHGEALYDAATARCPTGAGRYASRGPVKERHPCPATGERDSYAVVEHHWRDEARLPRADLFQRMTYLELKQRLPELLLTRLDRIAMASSVEGREPFLDHHLVEFALALPPRMKHRDGARQVGAAPGRARHAARRDARPPQAGLRDPDGGVAAGPIRRTGPGGRLVLVVTGPRASRPRCHRRAVPRAPARSGRLEQAPLEPLQRGGVARSLGGRHRNGGA